MECGVMTAWETRHILVKMEMERPCLGDERERRATSEREREGEMTGERGWQGAGETRSERERDEERDDKQEGARYERDKSEFSL